MLMNLAPPYSEAENMSSSLRATQASLCESINVALVVRHKEETHDATKWQQQKTSKRKKPKNQF